MPRWIRALLALFFLSIACAPARAERNLSRPPGTTRYAAMLRQLRALEVYDKAHTGRMTLSSLGKSVKGRTLWLVTLAAQTPKDEGAGSGAEQEGAASGVPTDTAVPAPPVLGPKRVFYLCRQHGHEPASTEGALAFINSLVKAEDNTPLAGYLKRATVMVVPMANPDGSEAFLRHNAHDVDLNRDWLKRTQPETRALYAAIQRLHPDLMTDQHELYPNDTRPDFTEAAESGSGASAAVAAACDDTQAVVQGAMRAEGFPVVSHWITDTHPARLAHRYGAVVLGVPTILFETTRLAGSGRTVAARAAAHEEFMTIVLRDAAGDRDNLVSEDIGWQAAHPSAAQALAARHQLVPRAATTPPEKGTD